MRGRPVLFGVIFILLLIFSAIPKAESQEYPWIDVYPGDIKVIDNPHLEAKLRLHAIRKANDSIQIATYDQRNDETIGTPLLKSLRDAADRNVSVKFIRGAMISKIFGQLNSENKNGTFFSKYFSDEAYDYLTYPPTSRPIEYLQAVSLTSLFKRGWSFIAAAHEKLLIIDHRLLFITGRGYADFYSRWLDSCLIAKGDLVAQASTAFDALWKTLLEENEMPPFRSPAPTEMVRHPPELNQYNNDPPLFLSNTAKNKLKSLKRWIKTDAKDPHILPEKNQLHARLLHHDFFNQFRKACGGVYWFYNYHNCAKQIQDPVIEELIRLTQEAAEMKFYSLSIVPHPALKAALLARLEEKRTGGRDFKLKIFTNGRDSHRNFISFSKAWEAGLKNTHEFLQAGAEIHMFDFNNSDSIEFVHRKGAVITLPDGRKFTFLGSYNLLCSASHQVNDEMSVEVESIPFGEREEERFEKSIRAYGLLLEPEEIRRQHENNTIPGLGWLWRGVLHLTEGLI